MDTKLFRVTPAIARDWLKRNPDNRPLRRSVVDGLKAAWSRGEYVLTHQGIAFSQDGNLLDGQHRLTAIAEMPAEFSCEMNVSRGLPEAAFQAIDIGLKRSASDILSIPIGLAAVGRFLATILDTQRTSGITPQFLVPFVVAVQEPYERLFEYCSASTKVWSSSGVRSAALVRLFAGGDENYIFSSYRALNQTNYTAMSPVVQSLHKQHAQGSVRGGGTDIFVRAYKAFDVKAAKTARIQINDHSTCIAEVREIISRDILGQRKPTRASSATRKAHAATAANWASL